jgi:DNA-binding GntR family transcriptional regulator
MGPSAPNSARDAPPASGLTHRILSGGDPRVPATTCAAGSLIFKGPDAAPGAQGLVARLRVPGRPPLSMADADDLFDLRAILESGAIRQAVLRATAQQLAALDAFRTAMRVGFCDFTWDDAHFHLTLAELSGNRRLAQETARLIDTCDRLPGRGACAAAGAERGAALLADHGDIIDALQARDAAKAVRLSTLHLARTRATLATGSAGAEDGSRQVEG